MEEAGSLQNLLMGNNSTVPVVCKGATLLCWTDRHAYEVMSVSKDGKRIVMQRYLPERIDSNGMSDSQEWKYEKLDGINKEYVYRYGAWRCVHTGIRIKESYYEQYLSACGVLGADKAKWEYLDCLYSKDYAELMLIDGKTEKYVEYQKVNIIFGVKDEYYDYSF